ncbi:MAG: hypothetical protein ACR2PL_18105, partial [Dehalococcoidia bacterium]
TSQKHGPREKVIIACRLRLAVEIKRDVRIPTYRTLAPVGRTPSLILNAKIRRAQGGDEQAEIGRRF